MTQLAILGGTPAMTKTLTPYRSTGQEEVDAATAVVQSGQLSAFIGAWCDDFDGGPKIKAFEQAWAERFGVRHAISMNSNTSGLIAAMAAIGIGPGDEVIVPPMTMSATVMAPLFYGGIPVFVDMERSTFCLDPQKVREAITERTRAILVVDLFGHPAALSELRALADEKGIYLIEDAAQAPLATENGRLAGTVGDIGIFSLNYHKHIHTGEGGVCVTDDDDLALRLRAIRNHGENVVGPLGIEDPVNLIGFNFRLTEVSAAIGIEQLRKADRLVTEREAISNKLTEATRDLRGLTPPVVRDGCRHVYYVWTALFDEQETGVSRSTVAKALNAEGVPFWEGYVEPLYNLPVFRKRIGIGRDHWPFTLTDIEYGPGLCPVAEELFASSLLEFVVCSYQLGPEELDPVIVGIRKVFDNLDKLRGLVSA